MIYIYCIFLYIQIIYWGIDECLELTHPMPYYNSPQDEIDGNLSIGYISFRKAPIEVYYTLLYWADLPYCDYPAGIGPFCGEMHLLSYMDSLITLCLNL